MELIPVEPIGYERLPAFRDYADGTGDLTIQGPPIYPRSLFADEFKQHRRRERIQLADAAERLGLTVAQVSGLEHGRFDLSEDDRIRVWELIDGDDED